MLSELTTLNATDERFEAKTTVVIELVRHHVKEEESELFRYLRDVGTRAELLDLGKALIAAKKTAPSNPFLEARQDVGGGIGAVIEHARDIGVEVVDRVSVLTAGD